ncbi:hypothetical protein [Streptomyces sp. NPDC098781]
MGSPAGFRERFCEFDDGPAAERGVRTLMLGEPMPVRPVGAERAPAHSMR